MLPGSARDESALSSHRVVCRALWTEEVGQRGRFFCTTSAHTGVTKEPSPCNTGFPQTHQVPCRGRRPRRPVSRIDPASRSTRKPSSLLYGPPWAAAPTAYFKVFHLNATALSPNPHGPMRSSAPTGGLLHTVGAAAVDNFLEGGHYRWTRLLARRYRGTVL